MSGPADGAFFDKLQKVLALTTSPVDGEALAAIRKANDLIASRGLTWPGIFEGERPKELTLAEKVKTAFYLLDLSLKPGTFRDFILKLKSQWERDGYLTPKQVQTVLDAVERQAHYANQRAAE